MNPTQTLARHESVLFRVAALVLLGAAALLFTAEEAKADHISSFECHLGSTVGTSVTMQCNLTPSGGCCGGVITWDAGDGTTGSTADDGYSSGYMGDASGSGTMSNGRTYTWTRSQPLGGGIRTEITWAYEAAGTYTVSWNDCCPDASGSFSVVTGAGGGIVPPILQPNGTPVDDWHTYDQFVSYSAVANFYPHYTYDSAVTLCGAELNSQSFPPSSGSCSVISADGQIDILIEPGRFVRTFEADFATGGTAPVVITGYSLGGDVVATNTNCASASGTYVHCGISSVGPLAAVSVTGAAGLFTMDTAILRGPSGTNLLPGGLPGIGTTYDFELGAQGWSASGAEWELGTPTYGASGAHSGLNAWGTDLDSTYEDYADGSLYSPWVTLPVSAQQLSWWHVFMSEPGYDNGYVDITTGGSWTTLAAFTGAASPTWTPQAVDISAFSGNTVQVRFHFTTDGSVVDAGWYVDDVTIGVGTGIPDLISERPPTAPLAVVATPGPDRGQLTVTCGPPADTGGATSIRYDLYHSLYPGGPKDYVTYSYDICLFTDYGLQDETTYYYHVTASNVVGTSSPSSESNARTYGRPSEPLGLTVVPGSASNELWLTWSAPTDVGGTWTAWTTPLPGLAYRIYRGTAPGQETFLAETYLNYYSDWPLDPDTTYYYRVSARNGFAEGPQSTEVSGSPYFMDGPYSYVEPLYQGRLDQTYYKIGMTVRYGGQTYGTILEGVIDGPLPYTTPAYPYSFAFGPDADNDGVASTIVFSQQTTTVDDFGFTTDTAAGTTSTTLDPNDSDDSNPKPVVVERYSDLVPLYGGRLDQTYYKIGLRVKYLGTTYGTVEEGVLDGPLPQTTPAYPYAAGLGADADGDGVAANLVLSQRTTTLSDTGLVSHTDASPSTAPVDPNDNDNSNPKPVLVEGPYTTVTPNYNGRADQVYYKLGLRVKYLGTTYGQIVEGVEDGPLPINSPSYPYAVSLGPDADGDGVASSLVLSRQTTTVTESGGLVHNNAAPTTAPVDPDDADDSNPLPVIVEGPYTTVTPNHGGRADQVYYKVGARIKYLGEFHGAVEEGVLDGPLPQTTPPYPKLLTPGADADGDGIVGSYVISYQTTTLSDTGGVSSAPAGTSTHPVDPDDADESNPKPVIVEGPYNDVVPSYGGRVDQTYYKVGVRVKFLGDIYGSVEEGVLDGPLPQTTPAYPRMVTFSLDGDADGVPAAMRTSYRTTTLTEQGTAQHDEAGYVDQAVDPDDADDSNPRPKIVDGPYNIVTPMDDGDTYVTYYKVGAIVRFMGQDYGQVFEGTAAPTHDADGDGIPDSEEATMCANQNVNFNFDGTCVDDDYAPPTLEGILADIEKILEG